MHLCEHLSICVITVEMKIFLEKLPVIQSLVHISLILLLSSDFDRGAGGKRGDFQAWGIGRKWEQVKWDLEADGILNPEETMRWKVNRHLFSILALNEIWPFRNRDELTPSQVEKNPDLHTLLFPFL